MKDSLASMQTDAVLGERRQGLEAIRSTYPSLSLVLVESSLIIESTFDVLDDVLHYLRRGHCIVSAARLFRWSSRAVVSKLAIVIG